MRSRLTRVGLVAAGLLALFGTTAPPAHADLLVDIAFTGVALVNPGLGYPCTNRGPEPITGTTTAHPDPLYLCAGDTAIGTSILPLPGDPLSHPENAVPNGHVIFHDEPHAVNVNSTTCVGAGASPLKLNIVDGPDCSFGGAGTVTGHCGLSGGQVSGGGTIGTQGFQFNVHFNGIASVLVVTGHVTAGNQNGLITGEVVAIPPTAVLTPPESCANLSATTFTIVGSATGLARTL